MQFQDNEEERSFSCSSSVEEGSCRSRLGLTLKKTPSFINLIESELAKVSQQNKIGDFRSQPIAEKMKASYFPLSLLIIGSWQRMSKNQGDLTGKIYYAKRKLVWEILEGALKSKIEIQWSDISAISVHYPDNGYGMLEIQLNEPPSFARETNPQPRKHTNWQPAQDFTGGQASICRRHTVYFSPGKLEKEYKKLLQCDQRLFDLSNKPFPTHEYPYFHQNPYAYSDFPGYLPEISHPQHNYPVQNFPHPHNFKQNDGPHFTRMNPHSAMSDEGGRSYAYENQWGNEGVNNHIQGLDSISMATIQENSYQNYNLNHGEESSPVLDVIENHLQRHSQDLYSDQTAFLEGVNSMYQQLDIQQAEANTIQDHPQSISWFPPDHQVYDEGRNVNLPTSTSMYQYAPPHQVSHEGMNVNSSMNMSMYQYALPDQSTMEDFAAARQNAYHWN